MGIGMLNESSLHSSLKKWYQQPGDKIEERVDGYIIDIVRGDILIEIQVQNFSAIRAKLNSLVKSHKVRLVFPIPVEKTIIKFSDLDYHNSEQKVLSKRKSPKKGKLLDVFDELVRLPQLFKSRNFSLDVLLVTMEEWRLNDGKGSWRRNGVSIVDKKLVEVRSSVLFAEKKDFLTFLPSTLCYPFTNKDLASLLDVSVNKARKITYCLKRMGEIKEIGKRGRELLYDLE